MNVQSSGLNAGYLGQQFERYLDNPEAVDPEWREFFEGADDTLIASLPGLERLVSLRQRDDGNGVAPVAVAPSEPETTTVAAEPCGSTGCCGTG